MKKLIIFLCVISPAIAFSGNDPIEKFPFEELAKMQVGDIKEVTHLVVNAMAGDADYYANGTIAMPAGFDILGVEPDIISQDEGQFTIEKVTQQGYVHLSDTVIVKVSKTLDEFAASYSDDKLGAVLQGISGSIVLAKVLDTRTHAEIAWRAHAEGHKYKGDGHIKAGIVYRLLRAPTTSDYQSIVLEITKAFLEGDKDNLNDKLGESVDKLLKFSKASR